MTIILQCKHVGFFHPLDEKLFFEWLQQLPNVRFEGSKNIFYFMIDEKHFEHTEFHAMVALFRRYKLDIHILEPLITADRIELFAWSRTATYHNVYPKKQQIKAS